MADVVVRNDPAQSRFHTEVDGSVVSSTTGRTAASSLSCTPSVDDELEGQGVGSELARAGLDYARDQGLQVVPQCPVRPQLYRATSRVQLAVR